MDSFDILLFLHIAAVIVALGATFSYPFLQGFAERKGVAATRLVFQAVERIEKFLVFPGGALVFIFGLGLIMTSEAPNDYRKEMPAWLTIAIVWYLVTYAAAYFVQRKQIRRAIAVLEGVPDSPDLPAAYVPIGKRIQMVAGLIGVSILGIALLMVLGPSGS